MMVHEKGSLWSDHRNYCAAAKLRDLVRAICARSGVAETTVCVGEACGNYALSLALYGHFLAHFLARNEA